MSGARAAAAEYRSSGFSTIPLKNRSKEPALPQLAPYLGRAASKEELSSWSWPGVGIVTGPVSGILVLDVDGPEGEAILKKHGHPITPMVRTGSGGQHLYFRHPPDVGVKTGIRVAPGLDVKAAGGYVVAPPSIGPTGKPYEWIISLEDADPADPPEWLIQLIERPRRNGTVRPVGDRIPAGGRNRELASLAGSMRRRGMGEEEITAALVVVNEKRCDPPLEEEEVCKIAHSVSQYAPVGDPPPPSRNHHGGGEKPSGFNLTDLGNAERIVARHGQDVRYCYQRGKWLVWTGSRWEWDDTGQVHRLGIETVRSIYNEAAAAEGEELRKALAKHATRSEAEAKIRAMLELAKSQLSVSPDELDADPWLLNAHNGTVDLRTGELRPHRREDLLTKMAGSEYRPDAPAPAWGAFLKRVLPGEDLRTFVQRGAGYSATGDTSEQCMFINHGRGANGKSTCNEALAAALGDYAMRTPTETLLAKRTGGVPNDVARLKGARFVAASETEEGRRLAESLVKDLTGQDTISARFMRAEWFDFKPTHKLWLSTNHKPEIRGTDHAIWRRIRLIPWSVTIPPAERDHKLPEKLCAELPGILAWVVEGCLSWRREGLRAPDEVRRATSEYRAEMDVLAAFLSDCCVVHRNAQVGATDLYNAYKGWAETSGERVETQRKFGARLSERGFEKEKVGGLVRWYGIGLRSNGPDPGPSGTNGPGDRIAEFAGETSHDVGPKGQSGPKPTINAQKYNPRVVMHEKGPKGPKGPDSSAGAEYEGRGVDGTLGAFLQDPPEWFVKQAGLVDQNPGLLKPTCSAIAYELYGYAGRGAEIEAAVSEWIAGEASGRSGAA